MHPVHHVGVLDADPHPNVSVLEDCATNFQIGLALIGHTAPISADPCRSVSRLRSERTVCESRARRVVMQQLLFVEHCRLKIAVYAPQPPIRATGRDF
jgi:hypothetical protein